MYRIDEEWCKYYLSDVHYRNNLHGFYTRFLFCKQPTSMWLTVCPLLQYLCMCLMHVFLNGMIWKETGEPGLLITYGFFNRWYFTGSISRPISGFIGMIAVSSERSTSGFCIEKSCLTRGAEGGKEWNSTSQFTSASLTITCLLFSDWTSLFSVNELPSFLFLEGQPLEGQPGFLCARGQPFKV